MLDVQALTYPATTVCLQGETRKGGRRKEDSKEGRREDTEARH